MNKIIIILVSEGKLFIYDKLIWNNIESAISDGCGVLN